MVRMIINHFFISPVFFRIEQRRMRCFQCGNSLPINDKTRQEKYPQYTMAQLHAHFYPTCEWMKEILGVKYIAQVLHDRYKSSNYFSCLLD
jgi:hypothetical protein